MFVNTVGTDTCLNQVSKKTPKTVKNNKKYHNIFEMFPEEITEKKLLKIDYKKMKEFNKKFRESDYYKECLYWYNLGKQNRL
jgi:hypothetical protein